MEIGTVVVKVLGREAGKLGVVIKKIDDNFISLTGPKLLTGVKRRRVNVEHIEPTQYRLEIKEDATDEEVIEAFKKSGLAGKLNLRFPSAAQLKAIKEAGEKVEEKKIAKAVKSKKAIKKAE